MQVIGKNIHYIRIIKGITIKEPSQLNGIREKYLAKIENGTAFGLGIRKVFIIAEELDVPTYVLFKGA